MDIGTAASQPSGRPGRTGWKPGPLDLAIRSGSVHVWLADLSTVDDRLLELLSEDERERAGHILGARERHLWSCSRGVLRALLARYLRCDPRTVRFELGAHGKPALSEPPAAAKRLSFNLSHSRELALYAFADTNVGIDVQFGHERGQGATNDPVALARRTIGVEEAERLRGLEPDEREREFLRAWTRHEAELKRRGVGLGAARVEDRAGSRAHVEPWIVELDVGPRAVAALAAERVPANDLRLWKWG